MSYYQLDDDKKSPLKGNKGLVSMHQDKRSELHTLTVNGIIYYYTGSVGLVALVNDFEKVKELGFREG